MSVSGLTSNDIGSGPASVLPIITILVEAADRCFTTNRKAFCLTAYTSAERMLWAFSWTWFGFMKWDRLGLSTAACMIGKYRACVLITSCNQLSLPLPPISYLCHYFCKQKLARAASTAESTTAKRAAVAASSPGAHTALCWLCRSAPQSTGR